MFMYLCMKICIQHSDSDHRKSDSEKKYDQPLDWFSMCLLVAKLAASIYMRNNKKGAILGQELWKWIDHRFRHITFDVDR